MFVRRRVAAASLGLLVSGCESPAKRLERAQYERASACVGAAMWRDSLRVIADGIIARGHIDTSAAFTQRVGNMNTESRIRDAKCKLAEQGLDSAYTAVARSR